MIHSRYLHQYGDRINTDNNKDREIRDPFQRYLPCATPQDEEKRAVSHATHTRPHPLVHLLTASAPRTSCAAKGCRCPGCRHIHHRHRRRQLHCGGDDRGRRRRAGCHNVGNVLETTHQSTTRDVSIQVQYDGVRAVETTGTSRLVPQHEELKTLGDVLVRPVPHYHMYGRV